jgi:hypothetical protein
MRKAEYFKATHELLYTDIGPLAYYGMRTPTTCSPHREVRLMGAKHLKKLLRLRKYTLCN